MILCILRPDRIGVERVKVLQNISCVCFNSHSQSVFYNLDGFETVFWYFLDTSSNRYYSAWFVQVESQNHVFTHRQHTLPEHLGNIDIVEIVFGYLIKSVREGMICRKLVCEIPVFYVLLLVLQSNMHES